MSLPNAKTVLDRLWHVTDGIPGGGVYAILDAARQKTIYPKVFGSGNDNFCLYRGAQAKELAYVAPYLVALEKEDPFTDWLVGSGWGDSWGIFVASSASLIDLRKHFRKFLTVYDEAAKPLLFRYYDPRVWRVYLPTCNASELKLLFGPVAGYAVESEKGDAIIEYSFANGKLIENLVRLTASAASIP